MREKAFQYCLGKETTWGSKGRRHPQPFFCHLHTLFATATPDPGIKDL